MKTDILIIPNDSLVLHVGERLELNQGWDGRHAPEVLLEIIRNAYVASHCQQGWDAYRQLCEGCPHAKSCVAKRVVGTARQPFNDVELTLVAQLFARGVGDRLEPLFPAPDDLFADPGATDAVWRQPTYLEPLDSDATRSDLGDLDLLVPSSRNPRAKHMDGLLTRRGIRTWAERKLQRMSEAEHFLPWRLVLDIEQRQEPAGADGEQVWVTHLRLKPGFAFLVTVETPDDAPNWELPVNVPGPGGRTFLVQNAKFPRPSLDIKPKKRWRLSLLSPVVTKKTQWPDWVNAADLNTKSPLPEGGKLTAIARRSVQHPDDLTGVSEHYEAFTGTLIPAGTTFFVEYEEPVSIAQSADILAGGS